MLEVVKFKIICLLCVLKVSTFAHNFRSQYSKLSDQLECGLSSHFNQYLLNNHLDSYNFNRSDIGCGAYGGETSDSDTVTK